MSGVFGEFIRAEDKWGLLVMPVGAGVQFIDDQKHSDDCIVDHEDSDGAEV